MRTLEMVSYVLLIIGGINWGLIGLFQYNLVAGIFGDATALARAIYILVGASAVFQAFVSKRPGNRRAFSGPVRTPDFSRDRDRAA
jgi:uncharacterized protein